MNFQAMLTEARAGKRVRLNGGAFMTLTATSSFTLDQINSDGWEVEQAQVIGGLTLAKLAAAWDSARPVSGSVGDAASSAMYKRMAAALGFTL